MDEQLDACTRWFTNILRICSEIDGFKSLDCTRVSELFKVKIPYLEEKRNTVENLIGHKRVKRGWFDGIGSVFKTIFGVLDVNDAEYYDQMIDKIQIDDKAITNLLRNQIQVVKSTITNFNETIMTLKLNEEQLNKNIFKFNNFSKSVLEKIKKLNISEQITSNLNLLTFLITNLEQNFDDIINAILFAKKNILHPVVITPRQIVSEFEKIMKLIPVGLSLPIQPSLENTHLIFDLCELQVFYKNEKIIFVINIPLTENIEFEIYKIIPLPIPHDGILSFAYIQPDHKYIAKSQDNSKYVLLDDISKCKMFINDHYLCKETLINSIVESKSCEVILLTINSKEIPSNCNTKIIYGKVSILEKLKYNQWIIINTEDKLMNIICNNENIKGEMLRGTNIFTLNKNCEAYVGYYRLIPDNVIVTEHEIFLPKVNIIEDDCCKKRNLNISHEYFNLNPINLNDINLDNLKIVSHTLDQMDERIKEINNQPYFFRKPSTFSIIIYILILFVLIYLICKCKKFIPSFKRRRNSDDNCLIKIINFCNSGNTREADYALDYRRDSNAISNEPNENSIEGPTSEPRVLRSGRTYNLRN